MPKSAQAFRTIREVADWLDVAAHVLRFWESKFNQIKPVKRAGGRRYYRPADMALVGGIKVLLHDRGLTIRGVQKMIADEGVEAVMSLSPSVDELLGNGDVIDLDPSNEWAEDAAAEAKVPPLDTADVLGEQDEAAPVAEPEDATDEEPAVAAQAPDVEPAPEETTDDLVGDLNEELVASTSQSTPVTEPSEPEPLRSTGTPDAAEAVPSPTSQPRIILPAANPAEGTLGTLAALSQLSPAHRASLAPQIADLARLRDRMSAPR